MSGRGWYATVAVLLAACSTNPTIPAGPASLEVVGTPAGTPGWLLDDPLAVKVVDAAGDPLAGATVSWSTAEPGAWLESATTTTDASGTATVEFAPGWRAGTQRVTATSAGLSTNLAVSATSFALTATTASYIDGGIRYCGTDPSHDLWCWSQGVLGTVRAPPAHPTDASYPVRVDAGVRYVQLIGDNLTGPAPMCGLTEAHQLRCWNPASLTPGVTTTPVPFQQIAETSAYAYALCGLDVDGQAWCRGDNGFGQLGDGTTTDRDTFAPVLGSVRFTALFGGSDAFCGLDADHHAWCWGSGYRLSRYQTPNALVPTRVGDDRAYVDLGFIFGGACGLEVGTAQLHCWGQSRMLGGPKPDGETFMVPVEPGIVTIAGRDDLGLFRTADGRFLMAGDMAEDPYVNLFVRQPGEIEGMPASVSAILSDGGNAWCVAHASGTTICGSRVRRPAGVPAPR